MRWGPLSLRSTIALSNLGVDTNVFNQPDAARLPQDFTLTFTPTTNLWLRMGRTWFDGTAQVDWVYFNRYASERGANSNYRIGVNRTFNRLHLRAGAARLSTRDRPNFEIDARSQRFEKAFEGEIEMRTMGKTYISAKASHRTTTYDKDAVFLGNSLSRELNRTMATSALVVRHDLTTLTSLLLEVGRDHDRFEFTPLRDSDSTRVVGTIRLQPLALVSGTAAIGYRHFTPATPDVPRYSGAIASIGLSYSPLGTTRLGLQMARDVQYSIDFAHPYYVQTGVNLSAQQRVYGPFDVLGRMGTTRLAHRDRIGAVVQVSNRRDRVGTTGVGVGYRLGLDKRVGFTLDRIERSSNVDVLRYSGLRYGISVTYDR